VIKTEPSHHVSITSSFFGEVRLQCLSKGRSQLKINAQWLDLARPVKGDHDTARRITIRI
jgi:hypothetical protein